MRIVVAVVVGVVLLGSGPAVFAAEARRERSEYCLDGCNLAFEKCQAAQSSKHEGRCNIEAVRCKNECPFQTIEEPAIPTARSNQRCVDACRDVYKKCTGRAENKRGGNCAGDDVRCEQACPKPPEVVAAPPAGAPAAAGAPGEPGAAPVAAPATAAKKPKRAVRLEGAAAPAPVSAPPVVVPERAPVAPPTTVRSEAATPPADGAVAARPAPQEHGFFGTLKCFFVSCEQAGATPCLEQCGASYDECHVRESKRGGECNTRLMSCRQSCRDAAPR